MGNGPIEHCRESTYLPPDRLAAGGGGHRSASRMHLPPVGDSLFGLWPLLGGPGPLGTPVPAVGSWVGGSARLITERGTPERAAQSGPLRVLERQRVVHDPTRPRIVDTKTPWVSDTSASQPRKRSRLWEDAHCDASAWRGGDGTVDGAASAHQCLERLTRAPRGRRYRIPTTQPLLAHKCRTGGSCFARDLVAVPNVLRPVAVRSGNGHPSGQRLPCVAYFLGAPVSASSSVGSRSPSVRSGRTGPDAWIRRTSFVISGSG